MCGIIGIVGREGVTPHLIDALKRLEYRGYDSAGVATMIDGRIDRRRAEGKLVNLVGVLQRDPLGGRIGIGHTRWATHGAPSETNAHPHASARVALVHNGIIENFRSLRQEMEKKGHVFETDTDTEAVVHLVTDLLDGGLAPEQAMLAAMKRIDGAFALAVLFAGHDDLLIGARRGSPLVVGYGDGEMFLGSDALGLAPLTSRISYLEEGDMAVLDATSARVIDIDGRPVERRVQLTELSGALVGKGKYKHFMEKEIHEQPGVVGDIVNALVSPTERRVVLPDLPFDLASVERLTIVACGTSYLAGLTAKYWIEQLARVPVEVDIASEFRYRAGPLDPRGLAVFISQSGETIDTLAALRYAKAENSRTLCITNVPSSAMVREADANLHLMAGPEIGVASTKCFMAQLVVLASFTLALARARGAIDAAREAQLTQCLVELPSRLAELLQRLTDLGDIVKTLSGARDVLYLGRGTSYPLALEGALKLKELSYIHAEGYAAGELKHGPIALIEEGVPVIVVAPRDRWFGKTASNIQEVAARRGMVIVITDREGAALIGPVTRAVIEMPSSDPFVAPMLYALPVQLLAYQVAVAKGTDVDQPRNLAKSVVVE